MKTLFLIFNFTFIFLLKINAQEFKGLKSYVDATYNPSDDAQVNDLVKYFSKLILDGKIKAYNENYSTAENNSKPRPLTTKEFNQLIQTKVIDTVTQINPVTLEEKTVYEKKEHDVVKIRLTADTKFDETTNKMNSNISKIDFLAPFYDAKTNVFLGYEVRFYILL